MNRAFAVVFVMTLVGCTSGKIGNAKPNVLSVCALEGDIPVYSYYAETDDAIQYYVSYGGKTAGPFDGQPDIMVSRDGRHVVYRSYAYGEDWCMITGNKRMALDAEPREYVSPNGGEVAYALKIKGQEYLYARGKLIGPYDRVYFRAFLRDGSIAYETETNGATHIVNGTERQAPTTRYTLRTRRILRMSRMRQEPAIDGTRFTERTNTDRTTECLMSYFPMPVTSRGHIPKRGSGLCSMAHDGMAPATRSPTSGFSGSGGYSRTWLSSEGERISRRKKVDQARSMKY